jgi:prevent-host-death family protein
MAAGKKPLEVSASDLKNSWHEFLKQVSQGRQEVVITRYGHAIAKLSPYEAPETGGGIFGCLAGSVTIHGDLVAPIGEVWEADG